MVQTRTANRSSNNGRTTRQNARRNNRFTTPPLLRRLSLNSVETDDDSDAESASGTDARSRPRQARTKAKRTARNTAGVRRSTRQTALPRSHKSSPNRLTDSPRRKDRTKHQTGTKHVSRSPPKKRTLDLSPPESNIPQGIIPNWQSPEMPYRVWVDIFYYAAVCPESLDVNWLLDAASICKAFTEPALSTIYQSPPIATFGKAKRLALLLQQPPSETRFNYRAKIKSLFIDIHVIPQNLSYQLISPLPRLRELVFFNRFDQPPYRQLDYPVRWQYSEQIFQALLPTKDGESSSCEAKSYPTALKSWEWSGRLLGGYIAAIPGITRIHQEPSFAHLSKISFTNFQVPSLHKSVKAGDEAAELQLYEEDDVVITSMAQAIAQLKSLKHLIFESSTVMNDRLLPLLPRDLVHLELINCWEIKSEDLTPFLHTHGRQLRTLNLAHCQSLDMAYLMELADACPELEELRMNLSYFRHHDARSLLNNDADPLYDQVLLPDQVPKWPPSLRLIDFEHIRHWTLKTAVMFLQSLIDSASRLPNLRHLAVKTTLDIPWKARANMRHEWRQKLDKVFLRPFVPPRNHTSTRQPQTSEEFAQPAKKKRRAQSPGPSRRSGRIAQQHSDSDSRRSNASKGLRSIRDRPLYKDPDTDEDEFDSDEEAEGEVSAETEDHESSSQDERPAQVETAIQGLCNTVSVIFDNQKPSELQYGMEDFMDDDRVVSDEEWDGDEDDDDTVFIWR